MPVLVKKSINARYSLCFEVILVLHLIVFDNLFNTVGAMETRQSVITFIFVGLSNKTMSAWAYPIWIE